jgi:hypothetical protein
MITTPKPTDPDPTDSRRAGFYGLGLGVIVDDD